VETFTDKEWPVPTLEEYEEWLEKQDSLFFADFKAYHYFVYLRHHGFPSPLLDWSASPYVAAFFAMQRIPKNIDSVSVYVYCGYWAGGRATSSREPIIHGLGPNVKADRRHFMQQSQYTICTIHGQEIYYANHEAVAAQGRTDQDLLWKFNLPSSEQVKVLRALNKMNINAFSLFGTEDSLMEAIGTEEMLLKERPFP
jgi:hypothetical protein